MCPTPMWLGTALWQARSWSVSWCEQARDPLRATRVESGTLANEKRADTLWFSSVNAPAEMEGGGIMGKSSLAVVPETAR